MLLADGAGGAEQLPVVPGSHVMLCAGCQEHPCRAGFPSCLQPCCTSLLPFLWHSLFISFISTQGSPSLLLVLARLTLWVLNSCWCRYQEGLNPPMQNLSHSPDGFHFSTSQIQVSCLTGHNWRKNTQVGEDCKICLWGYRSWLFSTELLTVTATKEM